MGYPRVGKSQNASDVRDQLACVDHSLGTARVGANQTPSS